MLNSVACKSSSKGTFFGQTTDCNYSCMWHAEVNLSSIQAPKKLLGFILLYLGKYKSRESNINVSVAPLGSSLQDVSCDPLDKQDGDCDTNADEDDASSFYVSSCKESDSESDYDLSNVKTESLCTLDCKQCEHNFGYSD